MNYQNNGFPYRNTQRQPQQGFYPQPQQFYPQQQQAAPQPKKSGAKYTPITKGKFAGTGLLAINAWRFTKNGLMQASCFPIKDGTGYKSDKGNEFVRYSVTLTNSSAGTHQVFFALLNMTNKKLVIQELGLVISPNGSGTTRNGKRVTGFFGANFKRS